ncbi:NaeI family type II restriction endonuclease [Labedaea rhizosphaerae]|nr:NaeI family type II restriction endonuclease [Labedaea rhizosphaerae]
MTKKPLPAPGDLCHPDPRKAGPRPLHTIIAPENDEELQQVLTWLTLRPITSLLRTAVDDAVRYVLDGARTWRFDLMSEEVDKDERSSVGTKLQYHVIQSLELVKEPPLDTMIMGIPVEIKGTVRATWMIPREGQCEITLMIQIDARRHRFRALLMRAHRAWLSGNQGNRDLKRSPYADAVRQYALEVAPWTDLPPEPLRSLTHDQLRVVFGSDSLLKRLIALFGYLPEQVIPRESITTVGAGLREPLRRAREAKPYLLDQHGLVVLVGTWRGEFNVAAKLGHDLSNEAWVAIPRAKIVGLGLTPEDFKH